MPFERFAARFGLVLFLLVSLSLCATAQTTLNAEQKGRAENLYSQLRCVVCQNQSILESDADVAKDLRSIVGEQIAADRTDSEIKSFLVERYGEFILLRPVFSTHTVVLWIAPFLFVLIGAVMLWRSTKRKTWGGDMALSEDEECRLNRLLGDHESDHL